VKIEFSHWFHAALAVLVGLSVLDAYYAYQGRVENAAVFPVLVIGTYFWTRAAAQACVSKHFDRMLVEIREIRDEMEERRKKMRGEE